MVNRIVKSELLRGIAILYIVKTVFKLSVVQCPCPPETELLRRVGNTRFYILHANVRGNFVSFDEALDNCTHIGLKLAQIKNMRTMAVVGRELEKIVEHNRLKDTWYWLDAKFDPSKDIYEWGHDGKGGLVEYNNFLYRSPRPTGVAGFIDFKREYHPNHDMKQCLTLALPWPGKYDPATKAIGVVFGHHTIFDERTCESKQTKHAMCESEDPTCDETNHDPFTLTEDKKDYFENGNWIFGDRRYIVNWKHRTFNESEKYCKSLGLEIFKPELNETVLMQYLKMWSRHVTTSQFWTGYSLNTINKTFLKPGNEIIGNATEFQNEFLNISSSKLKPHKSNKLDSDYCIAMALTYEFKGQIFCEDQSSAKCHWDFIDYVPANCNNYLATICQHENASHLDHLWEPSFFEDVDAALKATALTKQFGWDGHHEIIRSKYKQTFGVLYCPPGYRMLRQKNTDWYSTSPTVLPHARNYSYDYLETYWVVDDDLFDKDIDSQCTISEPDDMSGDSHQRAYNTVNCTEWHFYACERITNKTRPVPGIVTTTPEKMLWKEGRQPRVYPITKAGNDTDAHTLSGRFMMRVRDENIDESVTDEKDDDTVSFEKIDDPVTDEHNETFALKTVGGNKRAFSLWKFGF